MLVLYAKITPSTYSVRGCFHKWGQKDSELLTYVMENEEVLSVCLDDLDRTYDVAPSTIGLDYNEICNKRFHLTH